MSLLSWLKRKPIVEPDYAFNDPDILNLPPTGVPAERRMAAAVGIASKSGQDPSWTIDQMVRALTGDQYDEMVRRATDGQPHQWYTGIAPPDQHWWHNGVTPPPKTRA